MFRISGRKIAIEAAIIPVPGSALAQIAALIVIAYVQISWKLG
jgi:hypothetical protein